MLRKLLEKKQAFFYSVESNLFKTKSVEHFFIAIEELNYEN